MNRSELSSTAPALATHACDFCRERKIKCSRELPKCSACQPWPSQRVYSKKTKQHRTDTTSGTQGLRPVRPALTSSLVKPADDVNTRLDRIEAALGGLTDSINKFTAVPAQSAAESATEASSPPVIRLRTSISNADSSSESTANLVSLDDASHQLRQIRELSDDTTRQDDASRNLRDLSTAMTNVHIKGLLPTSDDSHQNGGFFVPTKAVGYTLMGKYLEIMALADMMTVAPSDNLLHQVIFQPQNVAQSAWVVTINFLLYALSAKDSSMAEIAPDLRNNARRALDDANLYLSPSEPNIQALLLLASHGDEFASPNLSWMLLGHACRQAQAIGLQSPTAADYATRQRQLCLFWALFMVDKTCALAFGRPCFLPNYIYAETELPDEEYLAKYRPHLGPGQSSRQSAFGGHFFAQSLQLARVGGEIMDRHATSSMKDDAERLQEKLDACYKYSHHILTDDLNAEMPECTSEESEELILGIKTIHFQYLHLSIMIERRRFSQSEACLALARQALRLLPDLVSNWSQVYNGPTWQLLYYPFTPFLVVFHQLTTSFDNDTRSSDLALLRTTVSYFENMLKKVEALRDIAFKLFKTATAFATLAESMTQRGIAHERTRPTGNVAAGTATHTASSSIENPDFESLLRLLPNEGTEFRGEKRSFDAAFDWFSWEALVNEESMFATTPQ